MIVVCLVPTQNSRAHSIDFLPWSSPCFLGLFRQKVLPWWLRTSTRGADAQIDERSSCRADADAGCAVVIRYRLLCRRPPYMNNYLFVIQKACFGTAQLVSLEWELNFPPERQNNSQPFCLNKKTFLALSMIIGICRALSGGLPARHGLAEAGPRWQGT